ncbi:MAG: glycosyl transferase family 1, partial [Alphaproteobacteria bacterium]|nr:glycosyl transferase family 1 [Alphaproteobacteria bacterium]
MTISVLLPYKENYSFNHAGAVSLFVKDMVNESHYKKEILVFGSTIYKKFLTKNYVNLELNKKIFQSTSKIYIKSFLES